MPESMTAEILQFRTRQPAPPAPPSPTEAEARLTRALAGLNEALDAQRVAVAAWKSSLSDLSTATGQLGTSLRTYNDSLDLLDARVTTLRSHAVKLEAWADDVLTEAT